MQTLEIHQSIGPEGDEQSSECQYAQCLSKQVAGKFSCPHYELESCSGIICFIIIIITQ